MHDVSLKRPFTRSLPPALRRRVAHLEYLGIVTGDTVKYHIYSDLELQYNNETHMVLDGGVEISKDGFPTTGGKHHATGGKHGEVVIIWHGPLGQFHSRTYKC